MIANDLRLVDGGDSVSPNGVGTSAFGSTLSSAVLAAALEVKPVVIPPDPAIQLLKDAGIDLSTLNPSLADAIRGKVTVGADGKLNLSGLYFNGLGDDLTGRINTSRSDLTTWIPLGGQENYAGGDSGSTYIIPISNVAEYSGGGGILRSDSPPEAALASLNAVAALAQHGPVAPSYLTPAEAAVFDRLIQGTGDFNWAKLDQKTLTGVLHALRANPDGSLNMSAIYGGGLGYDQGPPSDAMAVSRELHVMTDEYGQSTGQYYYYVDGGNDNWNIVTFTPPDPSVGTIVMEERGGGGDNGTWSVPVYKPSEATLAKYASDLDTYNKSFGLLTSNGGVQVRSPNGLTLNIGNENGYIDPSKIAWHPAFGLYTSTSNVKQPEDDGGWLDWLGDIVEVAVPMIIGAVFAYVGGPVGSFIFNYVMSDGDLDKALTGAALTYVTSGMGAGFDSAAAGLDGAAAGAVTQYSGLAGYMGVAAGDTILGSAINNAAASAIGAAAQGGDLGDVLKAGVTGAATGALGAYVTASVDTSIPKPIATAIGSGVSGMATAALTGGDVENAALQGMIGIVGAAAGQTVVGEAFKDSAPAVQNAVQTGTSALVTGLVNGAIGDVPSSTAIGQALGAGAKAYLTTPVPTFQGAQTYPVAPQGTVEVRPLDSAPQEAPAVVPAPATQEAPANSSPEPQETAPAPQIAAPELAPSLPANYLADWYDFDLATPPAAQNTDKPKQQTQTPVEAAAEPTSPEAATPAATQPPAENLWDWYDGGQPVEAAPTPATAEPATETGSAGEASQPTQAATDAPTETKPSSTRTVVVGTGRDNKTIWNIVTSMQDRGTINAQIGQILFDNGMNNSTVSRGQPLTVTPATLENYTQAQLDAFTKLAEEVVLNDNTRIANARQAVIDAQRERAAANAANSPPKAPDNSSSPVAAYPRGGSAPWPYTVPGSDGSGAAAPVETAPKPGVLTSIASLMGADAVVVGGTLAPALSKPWTSPTSLVASGGYFALANSDGVNFFHGVPQFDPKTFANGTNILRPGGAVTVNNNLDMSVGYGGTWLIKNPAVDILAFANIRDEFAPIKTIDGSGNNVTEFSANIGWALNGNDLSSGALGILGRVAAMIPTPQTQAIARGATIGAEGISAAKGTVGSAWFGAAYQVRVRFDDNTGAFRGFYTPQGVPITDPTSYLQTRVDRAWNVLRATTPNQDFVLPGP